MADNTSAPSPADRAPSADEALRQFLAARDEPCPLCGYNLRGVVGGKCPECARPLELALVKPAVVPVSAKLVACTLILTLLADGYGAVRVVMAWQQGSGFARAALPGWFLFQGFIFSALAVLCGWALIGMMGPRQRPRTTTAYQRGLRRGTICCIVCLLVTAATSIVWYLVYWL